MTRISLESAQSAMRASASAALAIALISGIDECQEEGHPLTQVQRIDLAKMTIMSYQTIIEATDVLGIDAILSAHFGQERSSKSD